MSGTALRCRLCERTQPLTPRSICPTCNGPLDVEYGLEHLTLRTDGHGTPHSMWRYAELLRRFRGGDDDARLPLMRSIAGIAAALRNTG